jgi:phosphohistidine swiveling domain-containing protein
VGSTELLEYARKATQAREWAKFEFTRNLSKALDMISEFGREADIAREDLAFLTYQDLLGLKVGAVTPAQVPQLVKEGRRASSLTQLAELPQLLMSARDFLCFERNAAQPNFVTTKSVEAEALAWTQSNHAVLDGRIVLIPQADPGFDWLFAYDIAGLITKYGGANSHMAIRAAERGLPAAIGVGDLLFEQLAGSDRIHLDCRNCQVRSVE